MQGCPLRCICCHNPDTWALDGGSEVSVDEIYSKIKRLRSYFGADGGLTVSGGEPLMQPRFVRALFERCHEDGIGCALDTSGCVYNDDIDRLLELCDLVLLDYKYTSDAEYREKCGCSKEKVDIFLTQLETKKKRVWLRQVIIPGVNDSEASVRALYEMGKKYSCIEKIELLPFRKLCLEKYEALGIEFLLRDTPEATDSDIRNLQALAMPTP